MICKFLIENQLHNPDDIEFTNSIVNNTGQISSHEQIHGLKYIKNALNEHQQSNLVDFMTNSQGYKWIPVSNNSTSRKTLHFGYEYGYNTQNIKKTVDIPVILIELAKIISNFVDVKYTYFNQCIINEYIGKYKHGIAPHIDSTQFGDIIACFTIGQEWPIYFKKDGKEFKLSAEAGSLYIMTGDSRYKYQHSIPSRLNDSKDGKNVQRTIRYSITFRHYSQK